MSTEMIGGIDIRTDKSQTHPLSDQRRAVGIRTSKYGPGAQLFLIPLLNHYLVKGNYNLLLLVSAIGALVWI